MLWDSNWANVEHRAGVRPVANHAGERAATKLNCCGLQNAIPAGATLTHRLPRKEHHLVNCQISLGATGGLAKRRSVGVK